MRRDRFASEIGSADFLLRRAAEDMMIRLQSILRDFPRALDLGCHHGIVTEMLLADQRIGTVISADLCSAFATQSPSPTIVCDEEFLPFAISSLDLIVSALTLHHVNDLPGTLIQIRRALKPDGLFLAAILGGQTLHELRTVLAQAEEEIDGGASPRIAPFADVRDLGALLQRAGFALPVTDADHVNVTYPTMFELMRDIRAMGASNVLGGTPPAAPEACSAFARGGNLRGEFLKFGRADPCHLRNHPHDRLGATSFTAQGR